MVRHHELGYAANAMTVFDVPEAEVDACGEAPAQMPGVTLCSPRARRRLAYSLYCMVHGRLTATARATVVQAVAHAGSGAQAPCHRFLAAPLQQTGARRCCAHTTHLAAHSRHHASQSAPCSP